MTKLFEEECCEYMGHWNNWVLNSLRKTAVSIWAIGTVGYEALLSNNVVSTVYRKCRV